MKKQSLIFCFQKMKYISSFVEENVTVESI